MVSLFPNSTPIFSSPRVDVHPLLPAANRNISDSTVLPVDSSTFRFSFSDLAEYPYSLLTEDEKRAYFEYLECRGTVNEVRKPPIGKRLEIVEKGKVTGKYLTKCLMEIQIWYDTKIIFCGNKGNAFLVCNSLFKRLNELFYMRDKDGSDQETAE